MEKLFTLTTDNFLVVILLLGLLAILIAAVVDFVRHPKAEKMAVVREWLLWAVARAETALGSGTGEKKLAMVYSWFEVRFPMLAKVITFEDFSNMVDEALEQLEGFLMDENILGMMVGKAAKDDTD